MDLKAVVEAGGESINSLVESVANVSEHLSEDVSSLADWELGKDAAGKGSKVPLILGATALAAAATAGVVVWQRRKQAAVEQLSGDTQWGVAPAPEAPEEFMPGVADADSPDVVDEQFAKEIDEAADAMAEEIAEAVEEPKH